MSYFVNTRKRKDGSLHWRVLREEWKDGKKSVHHIPTDQLAQHGLSPEMTVEDAKVRVRQLNAQARQDKQSDEAKAGALRALKQRERVQSAHLPDKWVTAFEEDYLRAEMDIGKNGDAKYKKALSAWFYVQRMIVAVDLPQQHWFQHKRRFYSYLAKQETAPDYAAKVLRILNLWGGFIAMKTGTSYIQVPPPKGTDREMIAEAYEESDKAEKESMPLTPDLLEKARGKMPDDQWRWCFVSLWFGLRPKEVDGLKDTARVEDGDPPVLWVYQTKLTGVRKDEREKPIDCLYPEQLAALEMIELGLKRPWPYTMKQHMGPGLNTYAGRKGFTDLMLAKGHSLEDIATWLGHRTIERTWRSYKARTRRSFRKTG